MIKFFRKIRYNLMEQNKTSKYLKYAIGEIILAVILFKLKKRNELFPSLEGTKGWVTR